MGQPTSLNSASQSHAGLGTPLVMTLAGLAMSYQLPHLERSACKDLDSLPTNGLPDQRTPLELANWYKRSMPTKKAAAALGPTAARPAPLFLSVTPGDFVIVNHQADSAQPQNSDWWMGQVIFCEGGARDPSANSLFQIADVDDGSIRWVNADQVSHILHGLDGLNP
ncbi:DUF3104 domain-containing protein [Synechococcus sp. UW140]|uniref:DUF3104 domain-containing protein n=1 Tax=Synechococcus sp. UW140 TaxID=368503 RepID=UPI00352AE95D